jgi:hypothetical protein
MVNEYERFIEGTEDSYTVDLGDSVGEVEIRAEPSALCYLEWGGWHWQAEGVDRAQAERRLRDRLRRLAPFDGFDTDWGDPGYKIGDLDPTIAGKTRELMEAWVREYERWQAERMDFGRESE